MVVLVALGVAGVLRLVLALVTSRLARLAARTDNRIDDAIVYTLRQTHLAALLAVGTAAGVSMAELPGQARQLLTRAVTLVLIVQVGIWCMNLAVGWLQSYRERKLQGDRGSATSVGALILVSRLVIGSLTVLIGLDNVGVDVTALITGLGIGGVAVALALQSVLGDLFASLAIALDRPFAIGDFLIVGEFMGTVEEVGLKTTRLRSLSGEQLVFANSDLLGSRIRNYGRMNERRVAFSLGVVYDTPLDELRRIPAIIRETILEQDHTRFDRSHFARYGDFALLFETVYFVQAADYNLYMDIQQAVNLRLRERFDDAGIVFAFPTQTLLLRADESAAG